MDAAVQNLGRGGGGLSQLAQDAFGELRRVACEEDFARPLIYEPLRSDHSV